MKSDPNVTLYTKTNSNWIKYIYMYINIEAKTIELWEDNKENIGRSFNDIAFGNDFLDMTWKTQATKKQIKWTSWKLIKAFVR